MNSPRPPLCLPQLLGSFSLRRSRQSYCPQHHAANLSPLTQDFTLFKTLQVCSPNPSLEEGETSSIQRQPVLLDRPATQTPPCQDSSSALWQQSSRHADHFNAIVPQGAPPVSQSPASWGWILEGQRIGHNLNLTLQPLQRCVCP